MKATRIMTNIDNMEVLRTCIEGAIIIEPRLFKDGRGYFLSPLIRESLKKKSVKRHLCKIMNLNHLTVSFVVYIFRNLLLPRVNWCV